MAMPDEELEKRCKRLSWEEVIEVVTPPASLLRGLSLGGSPVSTGSTSTLARPLEEALPGDVYG